VFSYHRFAYIFLESFPAFLYVTLAYLQIETLAELFILMRGWETKTKKKVIKIARVLTFLCIFIEQGLFLYFYVDYLVKGEKTMFDAAL
jgi:hypothetical protein